MNLEDAEPWMRVVYIPERESGQVSSKNDIFILVKFDTDVLRHGWDGATAKACDPYNLEKMP